MYSRHSEHTLCFKNWLYKTQDCGVFLLQLTAELLGISPNSQLLGFKTVTMKTHQFVFQIRNIFQISKHTQSCARVSCQTTVNHFPVEADISYKNTKLWEWFRSCVTAVCMYAILEGSECVVDKVDNCQVTRGHQQTGKLFHCRRVRRYC